MLTRDYQWYQLGQDQDYPPPNFSANTANPTGLCYPAAVFSPTCVTNEYVNVQADHFKVARNISREAITLLKNVNNTLPLSTSAVLKIFGSDAENNPAGPNACSERVRIGLIYHVLSLSPPKIIPLLPSNTRGPITNLVLYLGLRHWNPRNGMGNW